MSIREKMKQVKGKFDKLAEEGRSAIDRIAEGSNQVGNEAQQTAKLKTEVAQGGGIDAVREMESEQKSELNEEESLLSKKREVAELTEREEKLIKKLEDVLGRGEQASRQEQKDLEGKLAQFKKMIKNPEGQNINEFAKGFLQELEDNAERVKEEANAEKQILEMLEEESVEISDLEGVLEKDLKVIKEQGEITEGAKEILRNRNAQEMMSKELNIEQIETKEASELEEIDLMVAESIEFLMELIERFESEVEGTADEAAELGDIIKESMNAVEGGIQGMQDIGSKWKAPLEKAAETTEVALEQSKSVLREIPDLVEKVNETAQSILQLGKDISEAAQEGAKTTKNIGRTSKNVGRIAAGITEKVAEAVD